jgi:adenosylhomocysteine nucleosidase
MGDVGRILAVTGTRREASVLRGLGVDVLAIGGSAGALEGTMDGVAGIISFGMAGALDPALQLGDWVIGTGLAEGANCDVSWATALASHLPKAKLGHIYADGRLIADPSEKHGLFESTGALATDMESHLVAAAATRAGVPFAILRCISDEASSALPPAIEVAMKPDGGLALSAILGSILRNPLQIPDLVRTSLCFNRAYLDMQAGVQALGPHLCFVNA